MRARLLLRSTLALLLLGAVACGPSVPTPISRTPTATDLPAEEVFLTQVDKTMGFRDCFEAIRDPALLPADGPHRVTGAEMVLGVDLGTTAVAYPIQYLNHHEIVEHTVAGLDLLVCW